MTRTILIALGAAASLAGAGLPVAVAQTTSPGLSTGATTPSGTTSGPAAGSPTTLGSGGATGATPHQLDSLKTPGSAVTRETEQSGSSTGAGQMPGGSASGQPSQSGTQSGATPAEPAKKP